MNARVLSQGILAFRCTIVSQNPPAVSTTSARGVTSTRTGIGLRFCGAGVAPVLPGGSPAAGIADAGAAARIPSTGVIACPVDDGGAERAFSRFASRDASSVVTVTSSSSYGSGL